MDFWEIGKRLQEERLRQGVDLQQVAKVTRIGVFALKAIEEGNESALPGSVYVKGFVRSYARFLNLDQAMIEDALKNMQFSTDSTVWTPPPQNESVTRSSFPRWQLGLAGVALLILVGGGAMLLQSRMSPEHPSEEAMEDTNLTPPQAISEAPSPQSAWQQLPTPVQEGLVPVAPPDTTLPDTDTDTDAPSELPAPIVEEEIDQPLPVREDLDLQIATLDAMQLNLQPGNKRADFEVRNLTNDLISGQINVSFISREGGTFPALGQEDVPQFRIRNFRPVSTRLHLPPELRQEELAGIQFVITDSDNRDVFVKTYPVGQSEPAETRSSE
ncbi:helix-turn-helix domain-containing protein [Desulfonatronum thioautotrophicum]|uniref:helix-turn-helix domain-containing protein n=1 Tax=Desulfonatronum thioautotrophicum TaxID=617001 RepID=UPI0005EAEEFC|nr:helix-turn-helix domain-containing protein [Desulfonatronum thioautotrophicum]